LLQQKKSYSNINRLEPNLYDHFYLDLLSQNKQANILNIDSLNSINDLDFYFFYLEKTGLLEKTKIDSLRKQKDKNDRIVISDSIKINIKRTPQGKFETRHNFSRPFIVSNKERLLFFDFTFNDVGGRNEVLFFSKVNNLWERDTLMIFSHYSTRTINRSQGE
jgi:hypothetical protein